MSINYDISKPRILEVEALERAWVPTNNVKKTIDFVAKIRDARTGREGHAVGKWAHGLRLGDKVKVRWERTTYRDRNRKLVVKWAIRPVK